jgi:hypothetical protein
MMADDLTMKAAFASVEEDDGVRVVAFAVSNDPEDGYVFVQQDMADPAAPLYLEVSDEIFGAYDALESVDFGAGAVTLTIRPALVMRFGAVARVVVQTDAQTQGAEEAIAALKLMVG